MKSERRHELQQNELADVLGRFIKKAEPYAPIALTAVIAGVIAIVAVGYFQGRAATQRSDATLLYLLNADQGDPAALGDIAASYPNTKPAQLAQLSQADIYLGQGIEAMFTDRELARTGLQDALAIYEEVLNASEESILRSRAAFGIARAHEALGDTDQAIDAYKQVIEIHESDEMLEFAEQRINSLQRDDTQAFLAWFGEQSPQSAEPSLPPGTPDFGGLPDFSASDALPDQPSAEGLPQMPLGEDEAIVPSATDNESTDEEMIAPEEEPGSEPAEPEAAGDSAAPAKEEPTEEDAAEESPAISDETDPASEVEPVSEADPPSEDDATSQDDADSEDEDAPEQSDDAPETE